MTSAILLALLSQFVVGAGSEAERPRPPRAIPFATTVRATERPGMHHCKVRVRVVDDDGAPVAGATVAIYEHGIGWNVPQRITSAATDGFTRSTCRCPKPRSTAS